MSAHLDHERMTYLVYGLMEPVEKREADAHLTECPDCSKSMRLLEGERAMIVEATETPAPPQKLVRKVLSIVHESTPASGGSRRKLQWILACAAGALAAIGLALALSGGRDPAEAPVAGAGTKTVKLPAVKGRVLVKRQESWAEQPAGYAPARGERLRIDDAAGATWRLSEGSLFTFRQGSEIEIQGIRGPNAVLRVFEGEVHCNVVPAPEPCSIDVGSSKVTVVGTEFVVQVLEEQAAFEPDKRIPRSPRVSLRVISGSVDLRAGASDLRVKAGWIALAGEDGPPWIWGRENELQQEIKKAFEELFQKGLVPDVVSKREEPWRTRVDETVQAHVDAIPWKKLAEALVLYEKERDDAVKEQRAPRTAPDLKVDLELGWGRIRRLAAELRTAGDFMGACRNDLASVRFVEAMAEALAGNSLTEDQRGRLKAPEMVVNLLPLLEESATTLQTWKARGERILEFVKQLKGILTANQYHHLAHSVGPSFFSEDYRIWVVEAGSEDDAAEKVARIWMENFKLPPFVQAPLAWIAGEFVRAHLESSRGFRRPPGETLSRLQELELSNRHLEHQILAEGRVSQIPSLTEVTRKRALAGSKALFKIRITEPK
jgi:hypothetical protein